MIEYETELRELVKFVPEVANFEEYLCSKFEEIGRASCRERV